MVYRPVRIGCWLQLGRATRLGLICRNRRLVRGTRALHAVDPLAWANEGLRAVARLGIDELKPSTHGQSQHERPSNCGG